MSVSSNFYRLVHRLLDMKRKTVAPDFLNVAALEDFGFSSFCVPREALIGAFSIELTPSTSIMVGDSMFSVVSKIPAGDTYNDLYKRLSLKGNHPTETLLMVLVAVAYQLGSFNLAYIVVFGGIEGKLVKSKKLICTADYDPTLATTEPKNLSISINEGANILMKYNAALSDVPMLMICGGLPYVLRESEIIPNVVDIEGGFTLDQMYTHQNGRIFRYLSTQPEKTFKGIDEGEDPDSTESVAPSISTESNIKYEMIIPIEKTFDPVFAVVTATPKINVVTTSAVRMSYKHNFITLYNIDAEQWNVFRKWRSLTNINWVAMNGNSYTINSFILSVKDLTISDEILPLKNDIAIIIYGQDYVQLTNTQQFKLDLIPVGVYERLIEFADDVKILLTTLMPPS